MLNFEAAVRSVGDDDAANQHQKQPSTFRNGGSAVVASSSPVGWWEAPSPLTVSPRPRKAPGDNRPQG